MYGFEPYIRTMYGPDIPYNPYKVATLNIFGSKATLKSVCFFLYTFVLLNSNVSEAFCLLFLLYLNPLNVYLFVLLI